MHVAVIVERCIEKQRAARGNNKSKHRSNKHIAEDYLNGCFVQHDEEDVIMLDACMTD